MLSLDSSIIRQVNCAMYHLLGLALAVPVLCCHLLADFCSVSRLGRYLHPASTVLLQYLLASVTHGRFHHV
ncbi:MAG: hypothetical protein HC767_03875 [Akkermansiaceae bacterium]|nr:hypothetical protein [Akkermansiaceae bacterium]